RQLTRYPPPLQPVVRACLHSYPTRRSSDLPGPCPFPWPGPGPWPWPGPCASSADCASAEASAPPPPQAARPAARTRDQVAAKKRSEEHTSELQSRENLVCRLLLEKNK